MSFFFFLNKSFLLLLVQLQCKPVCHSKKLSYLYALLTVTQVLAFVINNICIFTGIRLHFPNLVKDGRLTMTTASKAQLGLGHSYSRAKVKFNVNRVDNMIIQSIALLDQLDKDINTFSMRIRSVLISGTESCSHSLNFTSFLFCLKDWQLFSLSLLHKWVFFVCFFVSRIDAAVLTFPTSQVFLFHFQFCPTNLCLASSISLFLPHNLKQIRKNATLF